MDLLQKLRDIVIHKPPSIIKDSPNIRNRMKTTDEMMEKEYKRFGKKIAKMQRQGRDSRCVFCGLDGATLNIHGSIYHHFCWRAAKKKAKVKFGG